MVAAVVTCAAVLLMLCAHVLFCSACWDELSSMSVQSTANADRRAGVRQDASDLNARGLTMTTAVLVPTTTVHCMAVIMADICVARMPLIH